MSLFILFIFTFQYFNNVFRGSIAILHIERSLFISLFHFLLLLIYLFMNFFTLSLSILEFEDSRFRSHRQVTNQKIR